MFPFFQYYPNSSKSNKYIYQKKKLLGYQNQYIDVISLTDSFTQHISLKLKINWVLWTNKRGFLWHWIFGLGVIKRIETCNRQKFLAWVSERGGLGDRLYWLIMGHRRLGSTLRAWLAVKTNLSKSHSTFWYWVKMRILNIWGFFFKQRSFWNLRSANLVSSNVYYSPFLLSRTLSDQAMWVFLKRERSSYKLCKKKILF